MNKKTVYVIGAGASKEAGLPTGSELKREIADLLDMRFTGWQQTSGDYLITQALRKLVKDAGEGDINSYLHEARHIRDAMPQAISIDNFLDTHRDNAEIAICGKLAIVRAILAAEKNSKLFFENLRIDSTIDFNSLEGAWYLPFFQLLTENCSLDDLEERLLSIVIIIFNYDRCVEHFMCHALQSYYRLSGVQAAQLVSKMNIYHPYGSVGSLPEFVNGDIVEFGADINTGQLLQLSRRIKTFTEGTDPESSDISAIKEHMMQANRLVFLGFAFHKLNMQLIAPGARNNGLLPKCYATTFNISKSDEEVIMDQISMLYNNAAIDTRMAGLECAKFFSEFWRSLAF